MSYHHFYKQLSERARDRFPGLQEIEVPAWEHLVSPIELRLPDKVRQNVSEAVRALFAVSRRSQFQSRLEPISGINARANRSVLMAYDFHTNEAGDAFLVEVNTNASGFMLCTLMEEAHGGDDRALSLLRASFENELRLWGKSSASPFVAICDEEIAQQKMYLEFLMYRDWFRQMGWRADFVEARDFRADDRLRIPDGTAVDLVYNRLTDFYFEDPAHAGLREGFTRDLACYSPNPFEYWLVGDKQRLVQFGDAEFLKEAGASPEEIAAITKVVIPSFDKTSFASTDEIWSQRRQLFFKPKRSHGGKSVYRGESVSRKVFERLMSEDILIQRYQAAQKVPVDDPRSVLENWKFDLRFYVYEDQIQLCAARIYQGQVTNFASPMGGFTRVRFV